MPKNKVSDLITDQEMVFVRLILSGTMTDQQAAEAAGLNPATAAYTKSKPRVRAYMLEHRALMQQQLAEQEAEGLRRRSLRREQVLDRLWELATMGPEITRGSLTGQVKALSMIVAIEGLIPDRRAGSAEKQPAPPPAKPQIYESEWLREQRENTIGSQTNPAIALDEDQVGAQDEDAPGVPQAEPAPVSAVDAPDSGYNPGAFSDPAESTFANRFSLSGTQWAPDAGFAPDTRVPFSIKKNPFARRRL
jgi:hypothetical protein